MKTKSKQRRRHTGDHITRRLFVALRAAELTYEQLVEALKKQGLSTAQASVYDWIHLNRPYTRACIKALARVLKPEAVLYMIYG